MDNAKQLRKILQQEINQWGKNLLMKQKILGDAT